MTAAPAPASGAAPGAAGRLSLASVLAGAVTVTLLRPVSWALGLAGFLAGGGLVLVAWPILVLPTPSGLQNLLGGPVSSLVFGGPSAALVGLVVGAVTAGIALVVVGTVAGAWAERHGIAVVLDAAGEDGIVGGSSGGRPGAPEPPRRAADGRPGSRDGAAVTGRVALIRLLAIVPVLVAGALAWQPAYDAVYRELVLPRDLVTPLPLRVLAHVPGPAAGVAVVWLLADAAGAVGVRRLVLDGAPVLHAWLLGWAGLLRRPHRVLPIAVAGVAVLAALLVPAMVAASIGWERVRGILEGDGAPVVVLAGVAIWVATWLGGLVLAAVGAAFRAAAWTLEAAPRPGRPPSPD